jgi:hypothetical protein
MADKDFNERTLDFWRPRTARKLSQEDARETAANVTSFFSSLADWDRNTRREQQQPPADGQPTET